jgi:hypothetical protein
MNILKTLRSEAFSFVYFIGKILLHKAFSSIHATTPKRYLRSFTVRVRSARMVKTSFSDVKRR